MKTLFKIACLATLLVSASCKNQDETTTTTETTEETVATTDTTAATTPAAPATPPSPIQPVQPDASGGNPNTIMRTVGYSASQTSAPVMTSVAPVTVAKGMNPPHGQPKHRCDIPVGAPLNSPPGKAPVQPMQPQRTTQAATITPAAPTTGAALLTDPNKANTVVTAPGMNPPHGQEGHRCDIAVGAPLPKA